MLLKKLDESRYLFFCPACDDAHVVDERWTFDGNYQSPTIKPSYHQHEHEYQYVCHLFIVQGDLHYLPDCTHDLAEKTVPMSEIPRYLSGEPEPAVVLEPEEEPTEPEEEEQPVRRAEPQSQEDALEALFSRLDRTTPGWDKNKKDEK